MLSPAAAWRFGVPLLALSAYVGIAVTISVSFVGRYPDGDQALVADMTRWFAAGVIKEPYFFGQTYLFPLGSYLAVPLVWAGLDPFTANQLVTAGCVFGPFLLIGTAIHLRGNSLLALVCYAVPTLFETKLLITALQPRGLVEPIGVAATLIGLVGCGVVRRPWMQTLLFLIIGACFGSAVTGIVLLPLALGLIILSTRKRRTRVLSGLVMVVGFAGVQSLALFYRLQPSFVVFPHDQSFSGSLDQLRENLNDPDIQHSTIRILIALLIPAVIIALLLLTGVVRTVGPGRAPMLVLSVVGVSTIVAFVLAVASTKLADSMASVYFSPDRILIGFVFVPIEYLLWFRQDHDPRVARRAIAAGASVLLIFAGLTLFSAWRSDSLDESPQGQLNQARPIAVADKSVLVKACAALATRERRNRYLLLSERSDLVTYGCHALDGIRIAQQDYDRRSWAAGLWEVQGLKPLKIDASEVSKSGFVEIPVGSP